MNRMSLTQLTAMITEKSFWEDPIGWISRGVAQGLSDFFRNMFANAYNTLLNYLESTCDTFTLFALLTLILAHVLGVERAKNYIGLVILFWLVIHFASRWRYM